MRRGGAARVGRALRRRCGGAGLSPRSSFEPETVTRVAPPVGPLAGVALETIGMAW